VLVGWFVLAVALALVGVYSAATSRIPTIQFGIVIPILFGCLMIWRRRPVSRLIDAVPRQWLIAIQFYCAEGVTFLVLYAAHLLPGLSALPAGLGDLLGIADLIIAVSTGRPTRRNLQAKGDLH